MVIHVLYITLHWILYDIRFICIFICAHTKHNTHTPTGRWIKKINVTTTDYRRSRNDLKKKANEKKNNKHLLLLNLISSILNVIYLFSCAFFFLFLSGACFFQFNISSTSSFFVVYRTCINIIIWIMCLGDETNDEKKHILFSCVYVWSVETRKTITYIIKYAICVSVNSGYEYRCVCVYERCENKWWEMDFGCL